MDDVAKLKARHPLATLDGISVMVAHLALSGALCPECGHGTRATSKKWARCKKCGERVQRLEALRRRCEWCAQPYTKPKNTPWKRWLRRRFCRRACYHAWRRNPRKEAA